MKIQTMNYVYFIKSTFTVSCYVKDEDKEIGLGYIDFVIKYTVYYLSATCVMQLY